MIALSRTWIVWPPLVVASAGVVLAVGLPVIAQTPDQQQPTFRTGVELVTVDVVVTDRDDRPIRDLTAADFEVFQDGRRQQVAEFQFIDLPPVERQLDIEHEAPPPDVAVNAPPRAESRLFTVVIDDLHLIETDIPHVRRILEDFLRTLRTEDQVAVTFVGRSDLGQDFTSNVGLLAATLDRIRDAVGFGLDARPHFEKVEGLSHARSTAWVLRNVARAMAGAPHGRRAIVLVSDGVNFDLTGSRIDSIENRQAILAFQARADAFEAAARAGVPIYTIDPRGLARPDMAVRGDAHEPGAQNAMVSLGSRRDLSKVGDEVVEIGRRIRLQQDYLAEIAINTGGRAFINRSNLSDAVEELMLENGSYYLLGYYPSPDEADGEFHDIDVRVSRPGVRVRARQGYVARNAETATARDTQAVLDEALGAAMPQPALPLRAVASLVAATADGATALVTVETTYPPGDELASDVAELGIIAVGPDAERRATAARTVRFADEASAEAGPNRRASIHHLLDLPDGAMTLRIALASEALGAAGSVHLPIVVPELDDDDAHLGGIVLGLRDPVSGALRPPPSDLLPFAPTTQREFQSGAVVEVFTRLFPGETDAEADGRTTATVSVRQGETTLSTAPLNVAASGHAQPALDVRGRLELAGLAAADYVLDVTVTLPTGAALTRRLPFRVR